MAGRKRQNRTAGYSDRPNMATGSVIPCASAAESERGVPARDALDVLVFKHRDAGPSLGQIPMAEFARMSTSRQLALWAILRAQISSQKRVAARSDCASPKALPLSPDE